VFIPAGTVHALGAGLLVAEIQQSSDTTFRLFDWNRLGADGKPRELHIRESLEVTDYDRGPVRPRRADPNSVGWQELVRCDKFVLRSLHGGKAAIAGDDQFHIITVPRGEAVLRSGSNSVALHVGQTVLLPAAIEAGEVEVGPQSVVLAMELPD
jgi:mannose-6-phosphate isomerase